MKWCELQYVMWCCEFVMYWLCNSDDDGTEDEDDDDDDDDDENGDVSGCGQVMCMIVTTAVLVRLSRIVHCVTSQKQQ